MEYDFCVNCGASRLSSDRQIDLEKIESFVNQGTSIEELLKKYPDGFAVAADGSVGRVLMASPHIRTVSLRFPSTPSRGGYLVIEMIDEG